MEKLMSFVKEYFLMFVGMTIFSFGWIGCIIPADGTGGGASGLALVLSGACETLFGISVPLGTMVLVVNLTLLLIAGCIVGWSFGVKTIYCIIVISFTMNCWEAILPEGNFLGLERTLSVILGGILAGAGVSICFAQGGSTGGTDIIAMIINHYRTISYGKILVYTDFSIITAALLLGKGVDTIIYGFVMTFVLGYTVDAIAAGNRQSSQVMIITHDHEKMAEAITQNLHRGVTLIDAEGWYTKNQTKMVMVICRKRETAVLLRFVRSIDPDAFVSVGSVMGVYGKGFQTINKV